MITPYVGITGFTLFDQVMSMRRVFAQNFPRESKRKLHVGIMTNRRIMLGHESSSPGVFVARERISEIFASDDVYNCLHFAGGSSPETRHDLFNAIQYGGPHLHALQLDMTWPDPEAIMGAVAESRRQIDIILQIGVNAFDTIRNDPQMLVERLEEYVDDGAIQYVLLDKSMGRGIPFDPQEFLLFARAIRRRFPSLGLVCAGGLGPHNIDKIKPLVPEFPDLGIDTEGGVRPSGSSLDPIEWSYARRYLIGASKIFS